MAEKQRILIVDDDANIAELISLYLTKECFETQIVGDGEEALKAFPVFKPNLVLLDLMLPGLTGEQFIVPECPSDGYENAGKYNPCGAGMYYFTATLYGTDGQVLDKQDFGQSGDSTETGYPSEERTPVQKFATERAKKWFSIDSENYADKTISSYDMLKQWSYQESDVDVDKLIAQTDPGTTMRFEIWREDPASDNGDTDVKVWEGQNWDLPAIKSVEVAGVASVKKDMQKLKSETVDLTDKTLFPAGTYYYRLVIQNPDVDTNPNYNTSTDPDYNPTIDGNSNIVWYDAKRVKSESFDIIEAQSKSVEPLWTNTMRPTRLRSPASSRRAHSTRSSCGRPPRAWTARRPARSPSPPPDASTFRRRPSAISASTR